MENLPNIEPFRQRYNELETILSDAEIFKDPIQASKLSREHGRLKLILECNQNILDHQCQITDTEELLDDEEFAETAHGEVVILNQKLSDLKGDLLRLMIPEDPDRGRNTIVEIRAGAGGDEASLFVSDIFRMYGKYSEKQGWEVECMSKSANDAGGFKEIILMIKGEEAWTKFKYESGVHRVQRVPTTEASGRIHTSTITVAVLPEAKEVDILIEPNDIEISVCRASGPGGQGVNTTDSAVQILHKPTNITVYCADERSQLKNKSKALTVLRSRLLKQKQNEENAKYARDRKEQVGTGDRSERIRTYNFPQSRVTDHRINFSSHSINEIMLGEMDELVEKLLKKEEEQKINALVNG